MSKDKIEVVGNYSPSSHSATNFCGTNGLAPTVMENHGERFAIENNDLTIRKITEKECMLLMGFDSDDYKAMKEAGLSTQAIAHIAGDSIVTTCIVSLLSPLIRDEDDAHAKIIERYVGHIVETRNN